MARTCLESNVDYKLTIKLCQSKQFECVAEKREGELLPMMMESESIHDSWHHRSWRIESSFFK